MPETPHTAGGFTIEPRLPQEKPDPSFGDTLSAAFQMDNDVYNAFDLVNRRYTENFPPTQGYNVMTRIREHDKEQGTNYWDQYRDKFYGVRSEDEFLAKLSRIKQQDDNRDTLTRAGWGGVVASVGAGLLSPTAFIPFIGAERGAAAVARGAALVGASTVAQEIPLVLNQETRTTGEVAFSIAASTVLGGLLGGAAGYFRAGERAAAEAGMADIRGLPYGRSPAGADIVAAPLNDAGRLAREGRVSGAAIDAIAQLGPVTRVLNQEDNITFRTMMGQLSNAGLRQERNVDFVPGALGGTIENRKVVHDAKLINAYESVDSGYIQYLYEGKPPTVAANTRAVLSGMLRKDKLSKDEFQKEVGRAMFTGDKHAIPEVDATAKKLRAEFQDPFLKEAVEAGLFGEKLVGDPSYLMRVYNRLAIRSNTQEFVKRVANHMAKKMESEFADKVAKLKGTESLDAELATDLQRPPQNVRELREQFTNELKRVDETRPEAVVEAEEAIQATRDLARLAREAGDNDKAKQFLKDARDMEKAAGEPLQKTKETRATLRRRLRNLTRSRSALEERYLAKLDKIERADELNLNALQRAARAGQKFLNKIDSMSDEEFDEALSTLRTQFAQTGKVYDAGTERLAKMQDADIDSILGVEALQNSRALRLTDLANKIGDAEDLGRDALRQIVKGQLDEILQEQATRIQSRSMRQQRLIEQAAELNPKQVDERVKAIAEKGRMRRADIIESLRVKGADSIDIDKGAADFSKYATELATLFKDRVLGSYLRVPSVDVIIGERGPELARILDIASEEIFDFIETDVRQIMASQTRTLGADIEIQKRFGTLDYEKMLAPALEEHNNKLEQIGRTIKDSKKLQAETKRLNDSYFQHKKDFETVLDRLRGRYGLPDDPESLAYRGGRVLLQLNAARFLGGVVIQSFADVGRPIMRYGLQRVMGDGFGAMIRDMKTFKMSAREIRLAGGATDAILNGRYLSMQGITDDFVHGTKFEKGVEFASSKIGILAGFDQWSSLGKQFTSVISIAQIMDDLDTVLNKATKAGVKDSTTRLAALGFDEDLAKRIWGEVVKPGGGNKVNGIWLPNTESWTDKDALMAFRQALVRSTNDTIITPGVELPSIMNANMPAKLLFQFKSFGLSSTFKTIAAGLQQQDAAMVQGIMVSLALGMLSYYTYAMASGGKTQETMLAAGKGKWADEAIERSGILGVLSDGQRIAQKLPLINNVASFSGQQSAQRAGQDMLSQILGPSYGFASNTTKMLAGLGEPTQSTLQSARTLIPFQNLFYIRRLLDSMVQNSGLPERRGE